ncbi:MAG: FmdB family zinc ribbon protein [Nocardioides sp.]
MPTYQYACTECEHAFDQVQSFSDASLTVCSECEGKLRKVFNAVGVVFKGSGFYRNDSRSASSTSDAPAAKDSGSGSKESGSDTSAGSKDSGSKGSGAKETVGTSSASKASVGSGSSGSSAAGASS